MDVVNWLTDLILNFNRFAPSLILTKCFRKQLIVSSQDNKVWSRVCEQLSLLNSCHHSDSYENICVYIEQGLRQGWVEFVPHNIFQCFITGSVTLEIGFHSWHQLFLWLIPVMNIHFAYSAVNEQTWRNRERSTEAV